MKNFMTWAVIPAVRNFTAERKNKLRDVVMAISDDDLQNIIDYYPEAVGEQEEFEGLPDNEHRQKLYEHVLGLYDGVEDSEELSVLQLEGMNYAVYITGGVSCSGQLPTEYCEKLAIFDELEDVYNLLMQFAREDNC